MKLLTLNFLCCARKSCKTNPAAFPLHPKEAELEQVEAEINPLLIQNLLPRINWEALKTISQEVRETPFLARFIIKAAEKRSSSLTFYFFWCTHSSAFPQNSIVAVLPVSILRPVQH